MAVNMAGTPRVCVADFETDALKVLKAHDLDVLLGGIKEQRIRRSNIESIKRWRLRPRYLREVSRRSTATSILGYPLSFPLCIAPIPAACLAHRDGDQAIALASQSTDNGFCLSMFSTTSIEHLSQKAGGLHFMEVFFHDQKAVTEKLVIEAESAGFKAVIVGVDPPSFVATLGSEGSHTHLNLPNIDRKAISGLKDTPNWQDIRWLKSKTHLPIIVNGILSGTDAILAVDAGADGILVSSAASRNLKSAPHPIDMLDEVVHAVEGRCEVYLQGSIRNGTDIVKALALGAQAVFVGSAPVYGLACNGKSGVEEVLTALKEEFDSAMALTGCNSPQQITRDMVIHESVYLSKL